jgi:PRTRC genetic system protein E
MTDTSQTTGLFTQLLPLLAQRAVLITISKIEEGDHLQVNICPRQLKDGENQALTTPLSACGTAAELDNELVAQVASFVAAQVGLHSNLSAIERELAEAERLAREEAKKKQKTVGNGGKKVDQVAKPAEAEVKPEPPAAQTLSLFDAPVAEAAKEGGCRMPE